MHQSRVAFVLVLVLFVTSIAGTAAAQSSPPPARTGFQFALRQGIAIPLGEVAKDSNLNDFLAPQFAFILDIGGKILPSLFLGGYLGIGLGGAGDKSKGTCGDSRCTSVSARAGAQIQFHIIPDGRVNPWVGYGLGYESSSISNGLSTQAASGFELAHFMAGADIRISRVFGVGPFVDFSIGQYSKYEASALFGKASGDIENKALHEWLTLGVRFTFFP